MNMKRFWLAAFSVLMLMMSWEGQLTAANVLDNGPIPQESIRLRIIANSDSLQDQWLKREVRDAIVAQMNEWVTEIRSYEEARQVVAARLPELQQLVDKTIRERGFAYPAVVEFGRVPFPTKLYGSYVYPAGDYEALRVRIGEAKGQNWWCVLFPPLCFIDMSNGDAVQAASAAPQTEPAPSGQADGRAEAAAGQPTLPAVMADVDAVRDAFEERRQARLEARWFGDAETAGRTDQPAADQAANPYEAAGHVAKTERQPAGEERQTTDDRETTAAQPNVEVRFFLWEKLTALFS
jgi:stage II sporulation protein R